MTPHKSKSRSLSALLCAVLGILPSQAKESEKLKDVKPSLYDFSYNSLDGSGKINFSDFKGKVVMVVNTASECGFTDQYAGLEEIYKKYMDQGFVVIGIPSNDFKGQEPGTNAEIANFCQLNYGVTFPMTEKTPDISKDPFFNWAYEQNGFGSAPKWNFQKYLFNKKGEAVTYYYSVTTPNSSKVTDEIEKLLKE